MSLCELPHRAQDDLKWDNEVCVGTMRCVLEQKLNSKFFLGEE